MRYEAVRRRAIEERHSLENSWELALLVRRGVMAWMRAWPTVEKPQPPCHRAGSHADDSSAAQITIPPALCKQVTSVLVSMILPQRLVQLKPAS